MVRELVAQEVRGFIDIMTVHQKVLALLDHKGVDVADGGISGGFVNHVAQVAGRIGKLLRAVLDGGDAKVHLFAVQIIRRW